MHKLFNILFSRFVINVTLIIIQMFFIFAFIYILDEFSMIIYFITMVIGALICIIILNGAITPELKIPWLLILILFPILGVLLYLLNGKKRERAMYNLNKFKSENYMRQDKSIIKTLEEENKQISGQAKYILYNAHYPSYNNVRSKYYPLGEDLFEDLIADLKKAEKFIFLQFFIIDEGYMWDAILEILKEKVSAGVDVRIIYDDIGCMWTLPNNYYKDLREMGIKCEVFNRLKPILSIIYNNRDHRKIVVIDGNVGFTGGINIADEYINRKERFGHWKDTGIKLEGSAVQNMTMIFLDTWHAITSDEDDYVNFLPTIEIEEKDGYFAPFDDNPMKPETVGETVYLNIINSAVDYVYITSPYLVLTYELVIALANAAKRGVKVRIITPAIPDKWAIHAITQSYYPILMNAGIDIYEYNGFIHAKVIVSDDVVGVVGTINLDFRSLYHHYENGVWIYNSKVLADIKNDINDTKNKSTLIDIDLFKATPWYKRIVGAIAKIFAPLM